MKDLSIRSTPVLVIIACVTIVAMVLVEHLKIYKKQDYYYAKIEAAHLNLKMQQHLKEKLFDNEIILNNINDPNNTGLVGQQFSEITTGRGSLSTILSSLNPNVSAMVVEQFKKAGLKPGDDVAICLNGSFPGLNIAVLSAVETLELNPVIFASIASSSWGANDINYTWLDMHKELYNHKLISSFPVAASIGGHQDNGTNLSRDGREKAIQAIERNHLPFIKGQNLDENILKHIALFNQNDIKLFINIGEGISSLGSYENSMQLPSGYSANLKLNNFIDKQGIIYEMVKRDIPVLNYNRINKLLTAYNLPREPIPLPQPGEGPLYNSYRYNILVVSVAACCIVGILGFAMYYDKKQNALGTQIITTS